MAAKSRIVSSHYRRYDINNQCIHDLSSAIGFEWLEFNRTLASATTRWRLPSPFTSNDEVHFGYSRADSYQSFTDFEQGTFIIFVIIMFGNSGNRKEIGISPNTFHFAFIVHMSQAEMTDFYLFVCHSSLLKMCPIKCHAQREILIIKRKAMINIWRFIRYMYLRYHGFDIDPAGCHELQ